MNNTNTPIRHTLVRKLKGSPDETRLFKDGKGEMEVFLLGDSTIGRGEFEPGWRWSDDVKPIAGTPSCQANFAANPHQYDGPPCTAEPVAA